MQLRTTTNLHLESIFDSNQQVNFKYFSKGLTKIKTITLKDIDKSYVQDCQIIIDRILYIQQFYGYDNRLINLSAKTFKGSIGDKRFKTAIHLLTTELGILDANHKYKFKGGIVSSFSKSYTISEQYRGDCIFITIERGIASSISISNEGINTKMGIASSLLSIYSNTTHKHTHNDPPFTETYNKASGRVFTSVNQMPKGERALMVDNEGNKLVSIDFSSSHLQQLIKVVRDDIKSGVYTPCPELIAEMVGFKDQVLNTDFYSSIAKEMGIKYTRDQIKKNTMFWLTGSFQSRKVVQYLRYKYSSITQYIDYVNANYSEGTKTLFGKRLPKRNGMVLRLMLSESTLVNTLVMPEFKTSYPNGVCYQIFDGFLVEGKYSDKLISIVNRKGTEYLKFTPKFKIETDTNMSDLKTTIDNGTGITTLPTSIDSTPVKAAALTTIIEDEEPAPLVKEVKKAPVLVDNGFDITEMPMTVDLDDYFAIVKRLDRKNDTLVVEV